jgi:hypothetical protein
MRAVGRDQDAVPALTEALRLYEREGNVVSAAAVRPLLAELGAPTQG